MNTYEKKSKELQEHRFHKQIFNELSLLIRNNIIDKEVTSSIDEYEKLLGFEFRLDYYFYKHKEKATYAFISKTKDSEDGASQYYIYALDYSRPELVKELITYSKEDKASRTEMIVSALNIIGVILCIFGVLGALFVAEEGILYFFAALVSFGVTALFFFALAAILTHLKNIDDSLSKQE